MHTDMIRYYLWTESLRQRLDELIRHDVTCIGLCADASFD